MKDCPDIDLLQAFGLGCLADDDFQRVAEHASSCDRCEAVLATLEDHADTLISNIRRLKAVGHDDTVASWIGVTLPDAAPDALAAADALTADDPTSSKPTDAEPRFPARFLHYQLTAVLGKGGMGRVFKASDMKLKRTVALKVGPGWIIDGPDARRRFDVEAQAVARLDHPNIVRLYEYDDYKGRPYFAMEFVDGGNLSQALAAGPLAERLAAEMVMTLAYAIQHAHDRDIIHRDLKPANVLLGANQTLKISDFGLAKLLDVETGQTRSEAVLGTVGYMSPELAAGNAREAGPLVDVYGLGAILYEALTGVPPFKGSKAETLALVRSTPPRPPSKLKPGLSPVLEAICLRCLEKNPQKRFASAQALGDDLGRWLRGEPTETKPPGGVMRIILWARRRPVLSAGLCLTAMAVAGILLALHFADPDRPVNQIERRLRNGEKVVLVGATGGPAWHRWRNGEKQGQVSVTEEDLFFMHCLNYGALELVRDPQSSHYRIRAEVKHDSGVNGGAVGLFFGMTAEDVGTDTLLNFAHLTFDDIFNAHAPLEDWPKDLRLRRSGLLEIR